MRGSPPRFGDYRLEPVYCTSSIAQRTEAVAFWLAQGALASRAEAERRSHELVFLVRRGDGLLAGVSTVALQTGADGRTYYVYRMFLRGEDRVPWLAQAVTGATHAFLNSYDAPEPRPHGMLIVSENPKLMRPGIRRYLRRRGCVFHGKTARGLDQWLALFVP